MSRAYLAPYGVGLGHASRLVLVADKLRENGISLEFSSYGEAASFIKMRGYDCAVVPPVEFAWSMEGGFSIKNSLSNIPTWFLNFSKQLGYESAHLASFDPRVVVSDSRLSPIFAAKLMNIPSVVILNQIRLLLSPRLRKFAVARLVEQTVAEFLGLMWDIADRILIPDLPPPYTLASHNLLDVSSSCSRLEFIGYTSARSYSTEDQIESARKALAFDRSKPVVFFHISGPLQTRKPLVELAINATRQLKDYQVVISGGLPNGSTQPHQIGDNSYYYEWCPIRDEVFSISDVIVMRGGHTALTQAIQFGKPVVTIPIENHGEQLGNSAKIAELGVGIMLPPKKLRAEDIVAAVKRIMDDESFKSKTNEVMKISKTFDGIGTVVKIISDYVK